MVTEPESHETDDVAPLEWRRHFYDRTDAAALTCAVVAGLVASVALCGAVLSAAVHSSHPSVAVMWFGSAMVATGVASIWTGLSGVIPLRRNRVTVKDGVTYVGTRAGLPLALGGALLWLGMIAVCIGVLAGDRAGVIQISNDRRYIPFLFYFTFMIVYSFWALAFVPMGRRLEFSPHELTGHFGSAVVQIPWDSIVDMSIYRGPSRLRPFGMGRQAEIAFTITDEATLPELPDDFDPNSYPMGLFPYDVDEDTLFNVILAARAHPEIRQLLGREEGAFLFEGPPLDTRKAMSRSQVWLPWEKRIQEALRTTQGNHTADPGRQIW